MHTYSKILFCAGLAALMSVSCNQEYPYQKVTPIDTPASVSLIVRDLDGEVALMAPKKKTFTLQIQARAIADELLTAIIKADPSLVESYNQAHGTSYEAVPAEAYEITTDRLFLQTGLSEIFRSMISIPSFLWRAKLLMNMGFPTIMYAPNPTMGLNIMTMSQPSCLRKSERFLTRRLTTMYRSITMNIRYRKSWKS